MSNTDEQTYTIRLPDGSEVEWTAQALAEYEGDWSVNLTVVQLEMLYSDIMGDTSR